MLLCVFGAGPAGAAAAEHRPASSAPVGPSAPGAPAEPTEGSSDPAADPEVRTAVRAPSRGLTGVQRTPPAVFHVKQGNGPGSGPRAEAPCEAAPALRSVRSVVLRC